MKELNLDYLIELRTILVKCNDYIRNSKLGVRFNSGLKDRLDKAKTYEDKVHYNNTNMNEEDIEILRKLVDKDINNIRVRKKFTIACFEAEDDKNNSLYILSGHVDINCIKEILLTELYSSLYSNLVNTSKNEKLVISFTHMILPDFTTESGELVSEIFMNPNAGLDLLDFINNNTFKQVKEIRLEVQGIKGDYYFGRRTA